MDPEDKVIFLVLLMFFLAGLYVLGHFVIKYW
jgi:hypothetical protein